MNTYETMFIIKPDLDEETLESVVSKFEELVKTNGGEVVDLQRLGTRKLAYEIEKSREGYYVLMFFRGPKEIAQEIERVYRITDSVMRHVVLRKD